MGGHAPKDEQETCSSSNDDDEEESDDEDSSDEDDDDTTSDDSSDEEDEEEDDDDDSDSDESLSAEIRRAEMEGISAVAQFASALGISTKPKLPTEQEVSSTTNRPKMRRGISVPKFMDMMDMMPDVGQEEKEDAAVVVTQPELQVSMLALMERMKNSKGYFQDPNLHRTAAITTNTASSGNKQPRRRVHSSNAMDDIKKNTNSTDPTAPHNLFLDIMKDAVNPPPPSDPFWTKYFLPVTKPRIDAYTGEVVSAARNVDIDKLRKLMIKTELDACNKQGETLVHLACRRRSSELLNLLVQEANVSVRVRDDWHKNALHELCWNSQPSCPTQFESVRLFLREAPELLFTKDRRGFSPLQYVPRVCWSDWCWFLERNKQSLLSMVDSLEFR